MRVVGFRKYDLSCVEVDPLLELSVLDHQNTGLGALGKPLKKLGKFEGLEISRDAHDLTLRPKNTSWPTRATSTGAGNCLDSIVRITQ